MSIKKWLDKNTHSLSGKTVAVSGATGGIGKQLCLHLAHLGASLVLVDRSKSRSEALEAQLLEKYPSLSIYHIYVDLEDIDMVKSAADELIKLGIDHLILNAGAYHIPRHTCPTGYGNVYQINFISPYYLARRLAAHVSERGGKIVAVGSIAHNYSRIDTADVDFSKRERSSLVYGNAKRYLMFSLFGIEHSECVSVTHPGITFTNITAHYPKLIFAIIKHPMKVIFMRPRKAALCILKGLFEDVPNGFWIGPRLFDVWGYPTVKKLKTVNPDEADTIKRIANEIYEKVKQS
ncbi:MAG: SDR family NAD(P)-dependent oxidoreductase [Ruminococcaceae bacterium]|nr:SDR family NAD(P)-dependent oxidoreductase [Oscillospiraceae bacterium]